MDKITECDRYLRKAGEFMGQNVIFITRDENVSLKNHLTNDKPKCKLIFF